MTTKKTEFSGETRFLILMRHAKSDWSDDSLADHDRRLNPRGRHDAPRMADWLTEVGLVPDMILSSTSVRTRETVDLMLHEWTGEPTLSFTESLYLATPEEILKTIRGDGCDARGLMVVAHNPGVSHLVSSLTKQVVDMPTAAIAVFQLDHLEWSEVKLSTSMSLIHYMRPKAL